MVYWGRMGFQESQANKDQEGQKEEKVTQV